MESPQTSTLSRGYRIVLCSRKSLSWASTRSTPRRSLKSHPSSPSPPTCPDLKTCCLIWRRWPVSQGTMFMVWNPCLETLTQNIMVNILLRTLFASPPRKVCTNLIRKTEHRSLYKGYAGWLTLRAGTICSNSCLTTSASQGLWLHSKHIRVLFWSSLLSAGLLDH